MKLITVPFLDKVSLGTFQFKLDCIIIWWWSCLFLFLVISSVAAEFLSCLNKFNHELYTHLPNAFTNCLLLPPFRCPGLCHSLLHNRQGLIWSSARLETKSECFVCGNFCLHPLGTCRSRQVCRISWRQILRARSLYITSRRLCGQSAGNQVSALFPSCCCKHMLELLWELMETRRPLSLRVLL